jgi:tetratricopeptide (TPR) repeat protein
MRLWFSDGELCALAQQRMRDGRSALRSAYECEYDRALSDALPDYAPERHALRWSLVKQLKENKSQLAELFDLEGEDAEFKGADDYLRRLSTLPELLRQCPHAKTEEEKKRWVEAVLGSISLSLAQKEHVAEAASGLSRFQYDELLKVFDDEYSTWKKQLGVAAAQTVRTAVLSQDFFPDMPDSHLAYEQIRFCFAEEPEALRFGCELFYTKHQDEWCYKAQKLAQDAWPQDAEIAYRCAWLLHEKLGCYEEAESAYHRAIELDEKDAYPVLNLARLLVQLGRKEDAESLYRDVVAKATNGDQQLLLQSHLFLGNRQLAVDALLALATKAQAGDQDAFFRLKQQVWECRELGLGERLADWMAESEAAGFLAPFIQALYTLAGAEGKLRDLPVESQQMVDEIVRQARLRQAKKC